ncbi:hypothetical protein H6S82_27325 [Planktothrix sp. FACHB-1355]|uniref:Uncharacterized protein n=1 Tax=Aerosakkonema funiforme FACHB-1375 TaxID=2949571 RepID=A0A926VLB5_9CYAN|nr:MULTISPECIES: hypothetical protein [Oscillatoriales]MBD2185911.1 hypothetical protein [Aerosakkonema funiforme FACHB-1375]MBD3562526.1 hypothetical protein [Planktothrix sp. FACHB-1355]
MNKRYRPRGFGGYIQAKARKKSTSKKQRIDPRLSVWDLGYWDKSWDDPTCEQHWEGASNYQDFWSLDKAINRAIELNLMRASEVQNVKLFCLKNGEYTVGDSTSAGWLIERFNDINPTSPYPLEPLWMLIDLGDDERLWLEDLDPDNWLFERDIPSILSHRKIQQLQLEDKIIVDRMTLPKLLSLVMPSSSWTDLQYQEIWLQCIFEHGTLYTYRSEHGRRIQIARRMTELEEADDEDDEDDDYEEGELNWDSDEYYADDDDYEEE